MERYQLLRWAQGAFRDFRARPARHGHLPPGQPRVPVAAGVRHRGRAGLLRHAGRARTRTRSWSTGWACSAGASAGSRPRRPCSASRSPCCCRRWWGCASPARPSPGITATDVVLTVTELLRDHGVVGAFVECYGPGRGRPAARDAGDHRQHEPRVRRHLHHVPDRPGDARLPALHRARRGAPGAGRGLRQGPGAVARPRRPRARLLRARHPRPGGRGALPGRPGPAPGPGVAGRRRRRLPRRARPHPAHGRRPRPRRPRTTR